jgi:hypothetical protein
MVQRRNYVAVVAVQIKLSQEECVKGMGQIAYEESIALDLRNNCVSIYLFVD